MKSLRSEFATHAPMLIQSQTQLDALTRDLKSATDAGAPLAFDTEFLSEKRYYARLCLLQVLAPVEGGVVEAAVDPFGLDLRALVELIGDARVVKIVHSGSIDLQILWQLFGIAARNVFDTQIAAAFLGYGHQIGYADMVRRFTGDQISKTMQYTDWSVRPLSDEQIDYAMADVRYLPPIYRDLKGELEKRGRWEWAQTEFERAQAKATRPEDDENAYLRLNLSGLKRKQLAVLREVARLRQELARDNDRPPSFIVPDLPLLQLARQQPHNLGDLRSIRGMPNVSDATARLLLEAVKTTLRSDSKSWPQTQSKERPDPRLDSIVALLGVVATATSAAQEISRSYLAPRDALWELAKWWLDRSEGEPVDDIEDLAVMEGWRGEILGRDLLRLLDGQAVIALDSRSGLPELRAV